jgi:hypothetical protein
VTLDDLVAIAEVIQNVAVGLAAFAAGVWALYRVRVERSLEPALTMEVTAVPTRRGDSFVVPVRLTLRNTGKVLVACRGRREGIPVWTDTLETLYFPLALQVRRLLVPDTPAATAFDWFDDSVTAPVPGLPDEINLLRPYETPGSHDTSFMLEPGDTAIVEFSLALPAGDHLIKGTFVGLSDPNDFWTDIRYVPVPSTQAS